ncbi:hypothetical protein NDU88_004437 [Pleurodeles waltl]|uniref:Uncharacterized protein n=1 Tax=Pleurodeles waltl TaxID=8319 RepID=A0AAV7T9Q3_PLEWA|nr:hypothetical protein NDU88_004437 [Pleurodeles waltl]
MFYFKATKTDNEQKRAMVVHLGGKDIYRIAKTINEAEPKTHLTLIAALQTHFAPMVNVDYERFIFRQARQTADESTDMFYLRLKEVAATCAFHNENDEIRGLIIQGCASSKLRERILEGSGRPLQDILTMGRTKELSKARASHMEAALQNPIKMEQVAAVIGASSKPKTQKTPLSTKTCGSDYRLTPHSTTGVAPGHLSMGRIVTDVIPHHESWKPSPINERKEYAKRKNSNDGTSRRRRARHSDIQEGDAVLIKDLFPGSNFRLPFEDKPWIVTSHQGSLIVAKRGPEQVARNVSWFKRFHAPSEVPSASPGHGTITTEMDGAEEDEELEHWLSNPAPDNMERVCERQHNDSDTNPRDPGSRDERDLRSRYHLRSNPAPSTMLRDFLL